MLYVVMLYIVMIHVAMLHVAILHVTMRHVAMLHVAMFHAAMLHGELEGPKSIRHGVIIFTIPQAFCSDLLVKSTLITVKKLKRQACVSFIL